jgi:hypothetical protein
MISNNRPEKSSIGTHVHVPPLHQTSHPQLVQQPTPYDYLALLPVLIAAATPLILGFKGKTFPKQDKQEEGNNINDN